jgi:hypothetical protein
MRIAGRILFYLLKKIRMTRLLLVLLLCFPALVLAQKHVTLSEVTFIKPAKDHYIWEKAGQLKGQVLLGNRVAVADSMVYSFGGFDTLRAQGAELYSRRDGHRELGDLRIYADEKLIRDTVHYPGEGFTRNLFFYSRGSLYVGGGHDSGGSTYAFPDFWRYDLKKHTWSRLRDIPFYYARAPYVYPNDSGALILAATLRNDQFKEATPALFQYNTYDDTWSLKSQILKPTDLAQTPPDSIIKSTLEPVSFRVDSVIYVLLLNPCGFSGDCPNSFFKLSLSDGTWTALPPFPGTIKISCFAFSDGTYGYLGGGIGKGPYTSRVVYRYDPMREEWTRIEDIPNGLRYAQGWNFRGETYLGFGITDEKDRIDFYKLKQKLPKGKKKGKKDN